MEKKNHISPLWPSLVGEFYNPEHENIKKDLLNYFSEYIKNNPSRKSGENYKLYESQYNLHTEGNEYFNKLINVPFKFSSQGSEIMFKNIVKNID